MVSRKIYDIAIAHKEFALSQLCIGAIFFAMRSCEYLISTQHVDNKRTKILLTLRDIRFKKNGVLLTHDSHGLTLSGLVIITYEFQKNNKRIKAVHIFKTNDKILCPAKAWAYTVNYIQTTVAQADDNILVCTYYIDQG